MTELTTEQLQAITDTREPELPFYVLTDAELEIVNHALAQQGVAQLDAPCKVVDVVRRVGWMLDLALSEDEGDETEGEHEQQYDKQPPEWGTL